MLLVLTRKHPVIFVCFISSKYEFNPLRHGHVSNGKIKAHGDKNVSIPQEVEFIFATKQNLVIEIGFICVY